MMSVQQARQLHDRATRGEALTDVERAQREVRHAQQDQEGLALLGQAPGDTACAEIAWP